MKYFKKNEQTFIVLTILCLFGLLLFKNPFSQRSLIPNLEPYPDALYYIVPARNLAAGQGLVFSRQGRQLNPNVPPLYSLVISPFFIFNQDPRMFYFANIFLAGLSFFWFYKILNQLTRNKWIVNLVLFFYTTNYFIYWYPTIPMAENLNLPIYLFGLWLILQPVTLRKLILMAFLPVALVATKYANLPMAITFLGVFVWKIIYQLQAKDKISKIFSFGLSLLISGLLFLGYEYIFKNHNILASAVGLFNPSALFGHSSGQQQAVATSWFSVQYLKQNLPIYLNAVTGHPIAFLWENSSLVPIYIGVVGLIGLVVGSFQKNSRLICLGILVSIFSTILFLSTFYSADGRYIYFVIPALLIGLTIFLDYILKLKSFRKYGFIILIGLFLFYCVANFSRIKSQISLNLKYAETPWYYVSVLEDDKYFSSAPELANQKIAIISPMPPFLFDFYASQKYTMLPLSKAQEFRDFKEIIWGPNDYSDLTALYKSYLNQGYLVYVSEYGLGNEVYLHQSFDQLKKDFNLTKVHEGCFNACDLYQLKINDNQK